MSQRGGLDSLCQRSIIQLTEGLKVHKALRDFHGRRFQNQFTHVDSRRERKQRFNTSSGDFNPQETKKCEFMVTRVH